MSTAAYTISNNYEAYTVGKTRQSFLNSLKKNQDLALHLKIL